MAVGLLTFALNGLLFYITTTYVQDYGSLSDTWPIQLIICYEIVLCIGLWRRSNGVARAVAWGALGSVLISLPSFVLAVVAAKFNI